MEYGLIGEKLGHSFSKLVHEKIGNYDYTLKEISKDKLDAFMKAKLFKGINVTIPYKKEVIPYLSHISPEAEKIGAVNTVINKDGELYGYNTDIVGLSLLIKRVLLKSESSDLSDMDVIITGTGGTSLTAIEAAKLLGARSVNIISRTGKDSSLTYQEAYTKCSNANFLINCTPCGMFPFIDQMPIDIDRFPRLIGVVDAIYNPIRSKLIQTAIQKGIPAEGGLYMLVAQAVAAYSLFFSHPYENFLTESIFSELLSQKENIVLIGMPSCGKSTVGKQLAKRLHKEFIDIDKEIEKFEGKKIPDIFFDSGEAYFREIEKKVISEIATNVSGSVIATGGGAVIDKSNIDSLKLNGKIFWLNRPLELLAPTKDRPTASSFKDIQKRYTERFPLYAAYCDVEIDASESVPEIVNKIISYK